MPLQEVMFSPVLSENNSDDVKHFSNNIYLVWSNLVKQQIKCEVKSVIVNTFGIFMRLQWNLNVVTSEPL